MLVQKGRKGFIYICYGNGLVQWKMPHVLIYLQIANLWKDAQILFFLNYHMFL
jgi:hypothetical protein